MAGRGPARKPAASRQRRNKQPRSRKLSVSAPAKIPGLPNPNRRKWHKLTEKWWRHVWESPMAVEYLESDIDGLGRLALLVDQYYVSPDSRLMSEIRLQEARFGLSPGDRNRLGWEVQPHQKRVPDKPAVRAKSDPRKLLK